MYHKKKSNTEKLLGDTFMVLTFSIFSFGLYVIYWIFLKNKEFEEIDKFAPDAYRGLIIMTLIPFVWFFVFSVLRFFIFSYENLALLYIQTFGFIFILMLLIKYLFDFCISFGEVTNTVGLLWFGMFFLGVVGILGLYLKIFYLGLFTISFAVGVTFMQTELNIHHYKLMSKKRGHI